MNFSRFFSLFALIGLVSACSSEPAVHPFSADKRQVAANALSEYLAESAKSKPIVAPAPGEMRMSMRLCLSSPDGTLSIDCFQDEGGWLLVDVERLACYKAGQCFIGASAGSSNAALGMPSTPVGSDGRASMDAIRWALASNNPLLMSMQQLACTEEAPCSVWRTSLDELELKNIMGTKVKVFAPRFDL